MVKEKNLELRDFYEVRDLFLEEKLTQTEIEEGLEPIQEFIKVCITTHAHKRMYEEFERFCEYSEVEDLIISKATGILNTSFNEDFVLLRGDYKLAVVGFLTKIEGQISLVIKTVIRRIYVENGIEKERRVWIRKGSKIL